MENLNKTDIGLIGLAVMGENLALNMADKGIVLQDKPHTFHIVFGISPVAQGVQIPQVQFILESLCDACCRQGNFPGNKSFAPAFTFVIEQNAVYGKRAIAFAVILGYPETCLLYTSPSPRDCS